MDQNPRSLALKANMFLQIPRELRDKIYVCLFTSTRLTSASREALTKSLGLRYTKITKPAPNSLAILRTCHQINEEARAIWLGHILFNFRNPVDVLEKLSKLPSTTLSQIRHVRTSGNLFLIYRFEDNDKRYCSLPSVPELLPRLRLDKLTVLGSSRGPRAYQILEALIKYGIGWKELHYITPDSTMLGFATMSTSPGSPYSRKPQPSTWTAILHQRDGADSEASITAYRSTQASTPGTAINPCTRQVFEQKASSPEDLKDFGFKEDKDMMGKGEKGKELLFIVKRGRAADIAVEDGPPETFEGDVRHWVYGATWAEIHKAGMSFAWDNDEAKDIPGIKGSDEVVKADNYDRVDELAWHEFDP